MAIEPPRAFRDSLAQARTRCHELEPDAAKAVNWTRWANLHITLSFIGGADPASVPDLATGVGVALKNASRFRLEIEGSGAFPGLRRAQVVWLGIRDDRGVLAHTANLVRREISALGFAQDQRAFRGHITVGRLKRPADVGALTACLAASDYEPFSVNEVVLFESLTDTGASRYVPFQRFPLGD